MTSAAYRFGVTVIPGSFITFLLLLFMMALVFTQYREPPVANQVKLTEIFPTDTKIIPRPAPAKPVKPPEVNKTPPKQTSVIEPRSINPGTVIMDVPRSRPVIGGPGIDTDPIPAYVAQPLFPTRALRHGISGYAVVSLTITSSGSVSNPTLVEEYPAGYGFGESAIKAAEKLKYQPRVVDGTPVEAPNVAYKYSFNIED